MLRLGEEHSETTKAFNYAVSVYCINNNTISISFSHTRVTINHETLMVVMAKLKAKLNYAKPIYLIIIFPTIAVLIHEQGYKTNIRRSKLNKSRMDSEPILQQNHNNMYEL